MARVLGLGHVGIYVRDLSRMVAFYRDVLGMQITKQNWRARRGVPERRPRGRRPRDRPDSRPARRGRSPSHQPDLHAGRQPRRSPALSPAARGRGLPHRRRRQPRERHRLLLLRSRGQSHRGVLGDGPAVLGARRRTPSTSSSPTRSCWPRSTGCGSSCATCRWEGGWRTSPRRSRSADPAETTQARAQTSGRLPPIHGRSRKEEAMAADARSSDSSWWVRRWRRRCRDRRGRRASRSASACSR